MSDRALYDRLTVIASRDLDDRTISPGEAAYLLVVLDEKKAVFDLTFDQIVQLHAEGLLQTDEARTRLGL